MENGQNAAPSDRDSTLRLGLGQPPPDLSQLNPTTPEHDDKRDEDFIKGLNIDAICLLASEHNKNLPCRILESKTANGSFNACFFVNFYTIDQTWVVRTPILPALYEPWDKLQSEVCTMRYIKNNTTIPIPTVHAYGWSQLRRDDSSKQAFMIMEYVEGHSLTQKELLESPKERRLQFYTELVDTLAQLRTVEFPAAGSLFPHSNKLLQPAIRGTLSIPLNQLQMYGHPSSSKSTTSTTELINEQYRILCETFMLPGEDLKRKTVEKELFALDFMRNHISSIADGHSDEPFVLTHTDLRYSNIMVDDQLHIQGIIDWEWACTVPKKLFLPPAWVIGSKDIFPEFLSVLDSNRDSSLGHSRLAVEWTLNDEVRLHAATILRAPSKLVEVFYIRIYHRLFKEEKATVLGVFFEDPENQLESDRRLRCSERYTQYLKDNGLYVEDEDEVAQKLEALQEKTRKLKEEVEKLKLLTP